jgi:cell division protein FtsB
MTWKEISDMIAERDAFVAGLRAKQNLKAEIDRLTAKNADLAAENARLRQQLAPADPAGLDAAMESTHV